jgi:hypothetical protein
VDTFRFCGSRLWCHSFDTGTGTESDSGTTTGTGTFIASGTGTDRGTGTDTGTGAGIGPPSTRSMHVVLRRLILSYMRKIHNLDNVFTKLAKSAQSILEFNSLSSLND